MITFPPVLVCTGLSLSFESSINGLQRCPLAAWKSSLPLSDACFGRRAARPSCSVVFELKGEMQTLVALIGLPCSLCPIKDLQVLTQELRS